MLTAAVCTIGDEILIGQIVDTNSSEIARSLNSLGIKVSSMVSIADNRDEIISQISKLLSINDIVVTTGGLGPTKDDITKDALAELSGSRTYVVNKIQEEIVHRILHSRGLDVLDINLRQAQVPDSCEVIPNRIGTAPNMVFRFKPGMFSVQGSTLYSLPGVPFEAMAALPHVIEDIRKHNELETITHRTVMTFGIAESALSKLIEPWEDSLPAEMHLAYLPNPLTGVRLRLSIYGGDQQSNERLINERFSALKPIIGDYLYSESDDCLEATIGRLLRGSGFTLSVAESCTGGEISHLLTTIPGSSEYYLGSVTSYAIPVKEKLLGVDPRIIKEHGVVSSQVAAAMAQGVRNAIGSTYSVATTGLAGPGGDESNPEGTVWIGVSGPNGTKTVKKQYHCDRKRNIERFAASALDELRKMIISDITAD